MNMKEMKEIPMWVWAAAGIIVILLVVAGVLGSRRQRSTPASNALPQQIASAPATAPAVKDVTGQPASTTQPAQPPVVGVVRVDFSDILNYTMKVDELVPTGQASATPPPLPASSSPLPAPSLAPTVSAQKETKKPMSPEMRRRYEIWVERR